MHQALWCLTFSCDYTSACIPSWKSLDCCHLNMFFLASLTLLSYCKVTLTYKIKLVAFAISIFVDEFLTLLAIVALGLVCTDIPATFGCAAMRFCVDTSV